jgi:hypothetical protein
VLYGSSARLGPGGARLTPFPAHRRVCRALRRHRLGPADVAAGRAGACEPVHRHLLVVRVLHAHRGTCFCCPYCTLRADCVVLALCGHHMVHLLRIRHSGEGSGGPAGVLGRHGLERSPPPRGDVRALCTWHGDDAGGNTPCAALAGRVLMALLDLPALPRMVARGRRHRPAMCAGCGRLCRLRDLDVRLDAQCPARARARDRGVDRAGALHRRGVHEPPLLWYVVRHACGMGRC